jgi:L-iditol 2-dehydrogenase
MWYKIRDMNTTHATTARAAVLTGPESIEIREFPIPHLLPGEMLVEVEACGICGTDVHEFKRDPFGLIPVVLGHEGTGKIVAFGEGTFRDFTGKELRVGDSIVTSVLIPDDCPYTREHPSRSNLSDGLGVYGLFPDSDSHHLNGYFATHLVIRPGSSVFKVEGMTLWQRILIEPFAVTYHALERAKTTGLLNFGSVVAVQGCGPIGQMMIATLHTFGVNRIIAIDGVETRLEMACRMGASETVNVSGKSPSACIAAVTSLNAGAGVDFIFQCTGVPAAAALAWKYVRRGGGLCEVGFFMDNGECPINPHEDLCKKEITAVGSWVYTAEEYPSAIAMVKQAARIGLPIDELVTSSYPLDRINEAMRDNIAMKGVKLAIVPKVG